MAAILNLNEVVKDRTIKSFNGSSRAWKHFGFFENEDKTLDKTISVCKICRIELPYKGNFYGHVNSLKFSNLFKLLYTPKLGKYQ